MPALDERRADRRRANPSAEIRRRKSGGSLNDGAIRTPAASGRIGRSTPRHYGDGGWARQSKRPVAPDIFLTFASGSEESAAVLLRCSHAHGDAVGWNP